MNKLGVIQTITWTVGMALMSGSMHLVGLLGDPRRTGRIWHTEVTNQSISGKVWDSLPKKVIALYAKID